jgi:nitroreductase
MGENGISLINMLIAKRRSVFVNQFSGEKVDNAIIRQMLENANWAPTHKLTEPWRFVVFAGDGRKKLGQLQAELYQKTTTTDGTFVQKKFENLSNMPMDASHVIVIGLKRNADVIREIEEVEAVACAVQNMYLTATAYGIGCYWGTGGVTYMKGAKELFGWSEGDLLLGFLYVGHLKEPLPIGKRNPIENKVTWIER